MKYSIIYNSQTGNTAQLAKAIQANITGEIEYFGPIKDVDSEVLFIGFWTNKGNCSDEMTTYLKSLNHKSIFLFGTCGFGESSQYFDKIIENVKKHINNTNTVIGSYMCQGQMPMTVRDRYVKMAKENPQRFQPMIDNFDKALSHPNQNDLNNLIQAIKKTAV